VIEKGFETIKQLKSWLSVNPIIGCPSECKYCFRHNDNLYDFHRPIELQSSEDATNDLLQYKLFTPDVTAIAIHNMATDPFLPKPKRTTFEILKKLDSLGYKNPIGLITKYLVSEDDVSFLESLTSVRPFVLVSYSEMPKSVEPIGNELRKRTLQNLSNSGVRTILYWRPIVDGWNTSEHDIDTVLEYGDMYADAFVISGLKTSQRILDFLGREGLSVPYGADPLHKKLPQEIVNRIIAKHGEKGISKPLFKRTSCSVSHLLGMPDYNAHWNNPEKNCLETCPYEQKERCLSVKEPDGKSVKRLLENLGHNMGFEIHPKFLRTETSLQQEEKTYLRHNLLFPIL
jgi:DNA repair photolyase